MSSEWSERWTDIQKLLERPGPFTHEDFEPSSETLQMIQDNINILIIGAGGLGCELLKDLGLMGFTQLSVIDMDLIDLSNLNRQFLFRKEDIGRPKAEVAADFINKRIKSCKVAPYYNKIQDFDSDFYRNFHIVVCGLDSISARRWINWMLLSLINFEDGMLDQTTVLPMIDGGTEGFKGSVRVILPGMTPCIECTLDLFPPQINYPLCTIANTPRIPEHCIEWVKVLLWPREKPYGEDAIDGDDPLHISWICNRAQKRAMEYGIQGVTYRLTQGVVKHIIPAVASTNAIIAAACATEALKLATSICKPMNNYSVFNQAHGVYTYTYEQERKEDCLACSQSTKDLKVSKSDSLRDVIDRIKYIYKMEAPSIQGMIDGKIRNLYMHSPSSIEKQLRANLSKSIKELSFMQGSEISVQDSTTPYISTFRLVIDNCS